MDGVVERSLRRMVDRGPGRRVAMVALASARVVLGLIGWVTRQRREFGISIAMGGAPGIATYVVARDFPGRHWCKNRRDGDS